MRTARKLALVALIASCEGRCLARHAVSDEVPAAQCVYDPHEDEALCVAGDHLIVCSVVGVFSYRARCHARARLIMAPEVPPP